MANGHVYPNVDQLRRGSRFREEKNVYYNLRDGTFADMTEHSGPGTLVRTPARGLAYGDLDNSGSLALVVNNLDSHPNLLVNRGKKQNWVSFQLVGTHSNRDAIGAQVTIKAGGVTQTSDIRSGCCYMSQSDMRLHFGLGNATKVDVVEVRWPNDVTEKFSVSSINSFQTLKEGAGVPILPQ